MCARVCVRVCGEVQLAIRGTDTTRPSCIPSSLQRLSGFTHSSCAPAGLSLPTYLFGALPPSLAAHASLSPSLAPRGAGGAEEEARWMDGWWVGGSVQPLAALPPPLPPRMHTHARTHTHKHGVAQTREAAISVL
eukprot:GHVU01154259.1.p3 GENE.GHVU01154259.1~~GHVU01154259.1.p3  ORF type:complete len:135 (+),score=10.54 GHVU01154259.1:59-463(+)